MDSAEFLSRDKKEELDMYQINSSTKTAAVTLSGPCYAKTCLWAYADSEGPDQPAHPRSLIRTFAVRQQNHWTL